MSLETQLGSLITAIGADVKAGVFVWRTGDAQPTGVTQTMLFVLATADTLPAWAPTGSIVIRY